MQDVQSHTTGIPVQRGIGNFELCLQSQRPVTLDDGGFGTAYLAVHIPSGKRAILKVIQEGASNDKRIKERFLIEAKSLGELVHAHIARLLDFGVEKSGAQERLYCAIEYGEHGNLEQYIAGNAPLRVAQALEWIYQAALALEYTHSRGMLHRDIKPSNFAVCSVEGKTLLKLIEFGLVKHLGSRSAQTPKQYKQALQSIYYASPEQIQKKALDIRSDIFSLGLTFWHMLEGRCPFAKGEPTGIAKERMQAGFSYAGRLPAGLPKGVQDLLRSMVALDPSHRPRSMHEVAQCAKSCLESQTPGETPLCVERRDIAIQEAFVIHRKIEGFCADTYEGSRKGVGGSVTFRIFEIHGAKGFAQLARLQNALLAGNKMTPPYALRGLRLEQFTDGVVVQEETGGTLTLKALVASTKGMSFTQALPLLLQLAKATDQLHKLPDIRTYLRPAHIYIHFPESSWQKLDSADPLASPLSKWPAFLVRLQIDYLVGESDCTKSDDVALTLVADERAMGHHALPKFASVIYYLMAARQPNHRPTPQSYIKLPGLTEAGNDMIRIALCGQEGDDQCEGFLRALASREGRVLPAPQLPDDLRTLKGASESKARAPRPILNARYEADREALERPQEPLVKDRGEVGPRALPKAAVQAIPAPRVEKRQTHLQQALTFAREFTFVLPTGGRLIVIIVAVMLMISILMQALFSRSSSSQRKPNQGDTDRGQVGAASHDPSPVSISSHARASQLDPLQSYRLMIRGSASPADSTVLLNGKPLAKYGTTLSPEIKFPLKFTASAPGYTEVGFDVFPSGGHLVNLTIPALARRTGQVRIFLPAGGSAYPTLKLSWLSAILGEEGAPAPAGEYEVAVSNASIRNAPIIVPSVATGLYKISLSGASPMLPDQTLDSVCKVTGDGAAEISELPGPSAIDSGPAPNRSKKL